MSPVLSLSPLFRVFFRTKNPQLFFENTHFINECVKKSIVAHDFDLRPPGTFLFGDILYSA